jgi:NADPH:quinone reductase-like Zn-dependent oxidoreductase
VLVTGATGGAGHFAVQLAHAAGARVVALIRRAAGEALVREAGADEVVIDESGAAAERHGPYHLVIDGVGGAPLTNALTMLAPEGVCVVYGATASGEASFDLGRFFRTGGTSIYGLILFHEVKHQPAGHGLARLAGMIGDGRLRPHIEVEAPWTEIGTVAQQLLDRGFAGKAVLHLE